MISIYRDIITYSCLLISSVNFEFLTWLKILLIIGCFISNLQTIGSFSILIAFAQHFLGFRLREIRMSLTLIIKLIYNLNLIALITMISLCFCKADNIGLDSLPWTSLISPIYMFMTEALLISIISFVTFINRTVLACFPNSTSGILGFKFTKTTFN